MSEPFFTDFGFGDYVVTSNGHYDHANGLWYKPWTDKPRRIVMGYCIDTHPDEERLGYTYLHVDVEACVVRWHNGPTGDPDQDPIVAEMPYR
ncbi:MAG TPA: hypothetical protein VFX15_03655 [Actinomycetes bacterium]|nr:hypothetical protein [Actinomycetes bacterium]